MGMVHVINTLGCNAIWEAFISSVTDVTNARPPNGSVLTVSHQFYTLLMSLKLPRSQQSKLSQLKFQHYKVNKTSMFAVSATEQKMMTNIIMITIIIIVII